MVPKYKMDVMSCEIVRLLQLTQNAIIPISFHVQRKVIDMVYNFDNVFFFSHTQIFMVICIQTLPGVFHQ